VGVRRHLFSLSLLVGLLSTLAAAQEQGRFAISQVSFQQPIITAYLDIRDPNGQPPANLPASGLTAKLRGQTLPVTGLTPFNATSDGVVYLFLLDISKSVAGAQFKQNQEFTRQWIESLSPADRMGLGSFGADYHQLVDLTADKSALENALASVKPTDLQTVLYDALKSAVALGGRTDQGIPSRRVIVVLSDGLDEGSSTSENDLLGILKQSQVPVFTLAASHLRAPYRQRGLDALNQIAASSQGLFADASGKSLSAFAPGLKSAVDDVFVASLKCDSCQLATEASPLEIDLNGGPASTAQVDLAVANGASPSLNVNVNVNVHLPWWKWILNGIGDIIWSKIGLALLILLLIVLGVFLILRTKKGRKALVIVETEVPVVVHPKSSRAPAPKGLSLRFIAVAGKVAGREYRVNLVDRVVVGRDSACDLALPEDTEVSSKHCELTRSGPAISLDDLKSTNGTLLNGARVVARRPLESGDLIRVGRTELRVIFEEPK
jgi:FHA domain/von Willebrand factor type A domain